MKKVNLKKGFTLIELLVVVAIIGILASVVLASLTTARTKAKDAAIKSQLSSMRAQAELYYNSNANSYLNVCTAAVASSGFGAVAGPGLLKATIDNVSVASAATNVVLATAGSYLTTTCHDEATGWAAEAPLSNSVSGTPAMYCVDSTGAAKTTATPLIASDITCN